MDITSPHRHLEMSVANFGPIAEGRIELRPMTVFVGPSNTGKSCLATLTYALHGFFNDYVKNASSRTPRNRPFDIRISHGTLEEGMLLSEDDIDMLSDWVSDVLPKLEMPRRGAPDVIPHLVPDGIAASVRRVIADSISPRSETLYDEIARCFGLSDVADLIRYPQGKASAFHLRRSVAGESAGEFFEFGAFATEREAHINATVPDALPIPIRLDVRQPIRFSPFVQSGRRLLSRPIRRESTALDVLGTLASGAVGDMVQPLCQPAYYLPADRGGVMHAHQLAVRGLIAGASRAALRSDAPMPALSGVLGDFLEQLLDLPEQPRIRRPRSTNRLAVELEEQLLKGSIEVKQSPIDYPSFLYRPAGWKWNLPLMNASSMVSELAPVALYLRYVVQPGDTLIIEEPESHLHPEMQVRLVRELAAAVKAGIRIIITTHSEWVLEELANLVRLSDLPPEKRSGIVGADVALIRDELGAWFFEPGADGVGSKVSEMPLDIDEGNFPSGFGLVTVDLYNRWAEISNRIEQEQ